MVLRLSLSLGLLCLLSGCVPAASDQPVVSRLVSATTPSIAKSPEKSPAPPAAKPVVAPLQGTSSEPSRNGPAQLGSAVTRSPNRAVWQALEQPVEWDFVETPLNDVIESVRRKFRIPVRLDVAACEDAGIPTDSQFNARLSGISLAGGLRLLLEEQELGYQVKQGVLLITTQRPMRTCQSAASMMSADSFRQAGKATIRRERGVMR